MRSSTLFQSLLISIQECWFNGPLPYADSYEKKSNRIFGFLYFSVNYAAASLTDVRSIRFLCVDFADFQTFIL